MDKLRQAAEQALKQLQKDDVYLGHRSKTRADAIEALRQALAEPEQESVKFNCTVVDNDHPNGIPLSQWGRQPEQEPVGYAHVEDLKREHHDFWVNRQQGVNEVPLYGAPSKREWVGLTDEEGAEIWGDAHDIRRKRLVPPKEIVRRIEAKLKEKNGG